MITFALLLTQDPLAKPVTLPSTVANAKKVVQALSKASGTKLLVHSNLEREIVGLAVPDRPLRQAMDALAEAMGAEWTVRDEVHTLGRSNKLIEARRMIDFMARLSNVRESLAEHMKSYSAAPMDEAAIRQLVKDSRGVGDVKAKALLRSPAERLLRGLVERTLLSDFAQLGIDQRIVYALKPTAVQRPLPASAETLFQRYAKEQKLLKQVLDEDSELGQHIQLHASGEDELFASATLTVFRQQLFEQGLLGVNLRLANAKGGITTSVGFALVQTGFVDQKAATRPFESPADDLKVEPSAESKRMRAHLVRRATRQNDIEPFPPEMDDLLRHPDRIEPLALIAEAPLAVMAQQRGQLVAAALPDSLLFDLLRSPGDGRTSLARWEDDLRLHFVERLGDAKTVIYRPKMAIFAEEFFTDRKELAKFLTKVGPNGRFSLQSGSQYAFATGSKEAYYAQSLFSRLKIPPPFWAAFTDDTRFFGSLTPAQKKTLQQGGGLTMLDLSPWQREYFRRKPYRAEANYRGGGPELSETERKHGFTYLGSLLREPTLLLPNGIPEGFELRAKVTRETTFHTVANETRIFPYQLSASYIAQVIHARENGDDSVAIGESYEQAETTEWKFVVRMDGSTWTGLDFADHEYSGKFKTLKELPEAMRAEIDRELAVRRKNQSIPAKDKVPPPL